MSADGKEEVIPSQSNGMNMIVLVGVTGAGKSYFINRLVRKEVVPEGEKLSSCTPQCQMIPVEIGNPKLLLIDTPGLDDTERTDADILNEIARVLAAQYALGFELKGVIYVHRITDIRYSGSNVKTFEIFKRICGEDALTNVLLITSRWSEVDEATGASRERQLRETFWAYMLGRGSCMSRFHGDRSSAVGLASQLLMKEPVVLRLQHEMIDEGKDLNETTVGSFVDQNLEKRRDQALQDIKKLEKLRNEMNGSNRAMKRRVEADFTR
ncbi:hypothetical protein FDECE_667 [Fusarium decemcellulare]|nr:hypothetical protein FDECE_667 [Fusarium decemcellulare]